MEIFTLLETLEDILEKSRNMPFSSKCIVDKEEVLDIIKEIRLKLPDELKQAKWVKEERQKILVQAQNEADDIIKDGIRVQKQFAKDMFNGLTDDEIALCKQIFKKICNNAEACIKAANNKVPAEK